MLTADLAVGIGGFLTMNLLPVGVVANNWGSAGSIVPGATGVPKIGLYLGYCIPAVIGSYILFICMLSWMIRSGIIQFGD